MPFSPQKILFSIYIPASTSNQTIIDLFHLHIDHKAVVLSLSPHATTLLNNLLTIKIQREHQKPSLKHVTFLFILIGGKDMQSNRHLYKLGPKPTGWYLYLVCFFASLLNCTISWMLQRAIRASRSVLYIYVCMPNSLYAYV